MNNIVTPQLIKLSAPETRIPKDWADVFNRWLEIYGFTSRPNIAMILSQTAHESSGFTRLTENLNYSASLLRKTWPKRYTTALANAHARKPELIANHTYGDRLGNINPGDGYKFRGRGLIQLTGRSNYTNFAKSIGITPDAAITYLQTADGAVHSSLWFWQTNSLSLLESNVEAATRKINGGYNGLDDRKARYFRVLNGFGK